MSSSQSDNTKRIAKNTLMLYVRMFVMMLIGLYTSRVILQALGISDLGLYNVAGGVVGMFAFLNGTLSSGTQRFLTFEIGSGNETKLKRVFESAMTLHALLAVVIIILSETIGLWYLYNKLNIEDGRFTAAMWCFQLSVLTMAISVIQIPFNAAIIAHEKMSVYAYMSIYDAATKLLGAYLVQISSFDRVISYSLIITIFTLISILIYNTYCRRKFKECSFTFGYDKAIFKDMLNFSGWNTIGCLAATGQSTGINLVINYFCGTLVNGARGIAYQASGWATRFVENFQIALNPQIVKYYASNDVKAMANLTINGAQFSSYLLLLIGIPLFIDIEWIIQIWLGECPEYVPVFLRIVLIESLFRTIGNPTVTAMHATGQMKWLNITVGSILLLILPISIILFKLGCSVEVVMAANIIPWVIVIPVRLLLLKHYCDFPIWSFIKKAVLKVLGLAILLFAVPYAVSKSLNSSGLVHFVEMGLSSVITSAIGIWFLGLNRHLREGILEKVKKVISI